MGSPPCTVPALDSNIWRGARLSSKSCLGENWIEGTGFVFVAVHYRSPLTPAPPTTNDLWSTDDQLTPVVCERCTEAKYLVLLHCSSDWSGPVRPMWTDEASCIGAKRLPGQTLSPVAFLSIFAPMLPWTNESIHRHTQSVVSTVSPWTSSKNQEGLCSARCDYIMTHWIKRQTNIWCSKPLLLLKQVYFCTMVTTLWCPRLQRSTLWREKHRKSPSVLDIADFACFT